MFSTCASFGARSFKVRAHTHTHSHGASSHLRTDGSLGGQKFACIYTIDVGSGFIPSSLHRDATRMNEADDRSPVWHGARGAKRGGDTRAHIEASGVTKAH